MKRVAIMCAAIVSVTFAVGAVVRASNGADVQTFPVNFVITSASCSNLPGGTTITGSGSEKSITTVNVADDGTVTLINSSHASGIATDQNGNTYVFQYSNEFRVSDSVAAPGAFTGRMTDAFTLAGKGPAKLNNGFVADIATDFASYFTFNPIQSHGEPIDFVTGAARCDPL